MGLFVNAILMGEVAYSNTEQNVGATYNLGDGNHQVVIRGSGTNVITGNGNSCIKTDGNNNTVTTGTGNNYIVAKGDNTSITTGNGNDYVAAIGNYANIQTGDGDDEVVFAGNNATINTGAGNDYVMYAGKNYKISTGDGDDTVEQLSAACLNGDIGKAGEEFLNSFPSVSYETFNQMDKAKDYTYRYSANGCFTRVNRYEQEKNSIDLGAGNNTSKIIGNSKKPRIKTTDTGVDTTIYTAAPRTNSAATSASPTVALPNPQIVTNITLVNARSNCYYF